MIIDSPFIIEMARGTDRRVPQEGDTQLFLPASVQPTLQLISPTIVSIGSGQVANQSACSFLQFTRTNQAPLISSMFTMAPGLYSITAHLAARFNFTTLPNASPDVFLEIINSAANFSFNLLALFASVGANFSENVTHEFLFQERFAVRLNIGLTGVGQTADVQAAVNAVRRL